MTISNSTIAGNTAADAVASGLRRRHHQHRPATTITNTTIAGNFANQYGGGIYNKGTLALTNSTIAKNLAPYAADGGGGIETRLQWLRPTAPSSANLSRYGGGVDNNGSATLANTIIAGNGADGSGPDFCGTVTTDLGYNLVQDTTGSRGFTGPHDALGRTPRLAGKLRRADSNHCSARSQSSHQRR